MSSSAVFMGVLGLAATFIPDEIVTWLEVEPSLLFVILLQMLGGLYLGFALLNWFTRSARVGGIYNRPVVLGNLLHYIVVGITLVRELANQTHILLIIMTIIYAAFAVWFGFVLVSNPLKNGHKKMN